MARGPHLMAGSKTVSSMAVTWDDMLLTLIARADMLDAESREWLIGRMRSHGTSEESDVQAFLNAAAAFLDATR